MRHNDTVLSRMWCGTRQWPQDAVSYGSVFFHDQTPALSDCKTKACTAWFISYREGLVGHKTRYMKAEDGHQVFPTLACVSNCCTCPGDTWVCSSCHVLPRLSRLWTDMLGPGGNTLCQKRSCLTKTTGHESCKKQTWSLPSSGQQWKPETGLLLDGSNGTHSPNIPAHSDICLLSPSSNSPK